MQSKIADYGQLGYRPVCVVGVVGASGMTYTANFVQESKAWTNAFGLSYSDQMAFLNSLHSSHQLRPEVISLYLAEDQQTPLYSVVAVQDLASVWTITGNNDPGLAGLDQVMTNAMRVANCTRAAIALSKDGCLVMSRGYTHHPPSIPPTQPTNGFRVSGVSEAITGVTVMGLVEAGRLQLDDKLGKFIDLSGVTDRRWTNITIRHLLQHRGGWDMNATFDPMVYDVTISTALHVPLPITKSNIITYMKKQWLQNNPGTTCSYSNFDYLLLGRVIEAVTGQDYESFVRQNVLAPLGIMAARVGRTLRAQQLPGEVEYEEGVTIKQSVMSPDRPSVAEPYGEFNLDNTDSVCGWVFSAEDLVRFGSIFFNRTNCALLSSDTIDLMWSPAPQEQLPSTGWYDYFGCGWEIQGINRGPLVHAFLSAYLPGTMSFLGHESDGSCWAVLFNTFNVGGTDPLTALNGGVSVLNAIAAITQWPTNDLFDADSDSLPDSWERSCFGSLGVSDGTQDHDGDGLSDAQEWIAMSDPLDAMDFPKISIGMSAAGNPVLQVPTHGGRVYSIRATSALDVGWGNSVVITNFNGDGFVHAVEVSATKTNVFYQLGVSLRAKPPGPMAHIATRSQGSGRAVPASAPLLSMPGFSSSLRP